MCETTMHVGGVRVRWNILYTDRDRIHLQFTMWILPLCCRHNVKQSWLKKNWGAKTNHLVRLKKNPVKAKIKALQRLTMDCFHFLNDDKNWNVFRYDTSVIGFSIPVHLQNLFSFWFFSSANMNIMLTTVVKTHHLSRVYGDVGVRLKTTRL